MDPLKPRYHLTPPANWMNDPNGAIYWNDRYHLFYQYNPNGPFSATKHWAHAVSRDLVHWEHLPVALTPTPGAYDAAGCFSGCTVINQGTPTIIYTGVFPETQCLATSPDGMITWIKDPHNPILANRPSGLDLLTFRDPYIWKEADDCWYMLLGSGIRDLGGACLLYRSPNLVDWEYLHPLMVGCPEETGNMWHCPNFFPVGDRYALVVSSEPIWKPFYYTGEYAEHHFSPAQAGLIDHGGTLYAPQVFKDGRGRTILWGWIWESRPAEEVKAAGWAGMMALPREVRLNPDGALGFRPMPEVEQLRGHCQRISPRVVSSKQHPVNVYAGTRLEIWARFSPLSARSFGLAVFSSADGVERTLIGYDTDNRQVFIDRSQANLKPVMVFGWPNEMVHSAHLDLLPGEELELHVYLDHSVIEVFTNRGLAFASRVYPQDASSDGVQLFARSGEAALTSFEVWGIDPIHEGEPA